MLELSRVAYGQPSVSRGPLLVSATRVNDSHLALRFENRSERMAVLEGFAACNGYPHIANAKKECPKQVVMVVVVVRVVVMVVMRVVVMVVMRVVVGMQWCVDG